MFNAIDVSKHQGTINWANVKNAGINHAMIRAGYGRFVSQTDPQFKRNVTNCELHGIKWGVYWYSYATSPEQAKQEARCCLKVIENLKPNMPVAYDIEYEPGILALTNAQRTAMVKAFLEEVEAAGYYGILYASTDFIKNRLNWKDLAKYDVWAAQYGKSCTCPLPFGIWQFSSTNAFGVPGFGSSLDCNKVYKDYGSIIPAAGLNGYKLDEVEEDKTPDLSSMMQKLHIGPVTNGDAAQVEALCIQLGLDKMGLYTSHWANEEKTMQTIDIGPVSSGDAWYIMRLCEKLQLTDMNLYHSEYAA